MRVIAFLFGVLLLLPGACSLVFMFLSMGESGSAGLLVILWLICFAISFGGILLIRRALSK
jgi:hypothetical protein